MIGLLLLAAQIDAGVTTHRIGVSPSSPLAATVSIPNHWGYSDQHLGIWRHRVVASANNLGIDSLRVRELRIPRGEEGHFQRNYGPPAFEHALPRGAVYVSIELFFPPIFEPRYLWNTDAGPDSCIARAVRDLKPKHESEEIAFYRIEFFCWGMDWIVHVAARKPFPSEDLDGAFEIVQSLRFPDDAIYDREQAAEVAIRQLPAYQQPIDDYFDGCGGFLFYRVDVNPLGTGFLVDFCVLDGTEERRVVRKHRYFVSHAAKVTPWTGSSEPPPPSASPSPRRRGR